MRLTVLQQQTKALREEQPQTGAEVFKRLESVKDLSLVSTRIARNQSPISRSADSIELSHPCCWAVKPVRSFKLRRMSCAFRTISRASVFDFGSARAKVVPVRKYEKARSPCKPALLGSCLASFSRIVSLTSFSFRKILLVRGCAA